MSENGEAAPGQEPATLRTAVMGLDRGAVRTLIATLEQRIAGTNHELHELSRRVSALEVELGSHQEDEDLEGAIELSRQAASGVTSDAREEYDRVISAARRQAEEIERDRPEELDDLRREVEVLRTQLRGRRVRLERALRSALDELDSESAGAGTAPTDVDSALRAFRRERPQS